MEYYNKEKHFSLIKERMKRAALENLDLDMCSRFDNHGNVLIELRINETDAILIKGNEFREICNEVYCGMEYHQAMTDYIAPLNWGFTPKQTEIVNKRCCVEEVKDSQVVKRRIMTTDCLWGIAKKKVLKTDYTKETRL